MTASRYTNTHVNQTRKNKMDSNETKKAKTSTRRQLHNGRRSLNHPIEIMRPRLMMTKKNQLHIIKRTATSLTVALFCRYSIKTLRNNRNKFLRNERTIKNIVFFYCCSLMWRQNVDIFSLIIRDRLSANNLLNPICEHNGRISKIVLCTYASFFDY